VAMHWLAKFAVEISQRNVVERDDRTTRSFLKVAEAGEVVLRRYLRHSRLQVKRS
jgi:hypothetical protein